MIKDICKDVFFLSLKAEDATPDDKQVGIDLMDTLKANRMRCVGMAANMIGVKKNVIIANAGLVDIVMFNPKITSKKNPYETEEGCLSLEGTRPVTRYEEIEVTYQDMNFKTKKSRYKGWTAQIIQHEIDHCNGIII